MIRCGELAIAHYAGWVILAHVDNERRVSIATYINGGTLNRFGWFNQSDNWVASHPHWLEGGNYHFATIRHSVAGRSLRSLSDDKLLYLMGSYTPWHKRPLWNAQEVLRKITGTHELSGIINAISFTLAGAATSLAFLAMTLLALHIVK